MPEHPIAPPVTPDAPDHPISRIARLAVRLQAAVWREVAALRRLDERAAPATGGFIDARETVAAAHRAGLSVRDHVERLWGSAGATARALDAMAAAGSLRRCERVSRYIVLRRRS